MLLTSKSNSKILSKRNITVFLIAASIALASVTSIITYTYNHAQIASANSCGDVFSPIPGWVTQRVNANRPVYEQVARETGVPWEVLAAVHYREFNLAVSNPANGQGIYQMYSIYKNDPAFITLVNPSISVDTNNFLRQTRYAANFIQDKARQTTSTPIVSARSLTANETDINLIKSTLFSYNGRASSYATQAVTYGYDRIAQPFEGSPYVMSKFDCKRQSMKLITNDGGNTPTVPDTRMGAFTLFARLKGEGFWYGLQVENIPGCTQGTGTTVSCVWRLYNPGTKSYVYTTDFDERNGYIARGYLFQNIGFFGRHIAAKLVQGQIPVYMLTKGDGSNFLTTNFNEYTNLKAAGWGDRGVLMFANPVDSNAGYPVYRLYHPTTGAHVWTENPNERLEFLQAGYIAEGTAFNQISILAQESPAPEGQDLVYRFGAMPEDRHFWTTNINERDTMIRGGYRYEGVAWTSTKTVTQKPVYRVYTDILGKHVYTTNINERNSLINSGDWRNEGIAWYTPANANSKPVYRLYLYKNHENFFTTNVNERNSLVSSGVGADEGIGWYQP